MSRPNLLVAAGHDPSGGAGIQADIESAAANGAHAACVITLLTCQDTARLHSTAGVDPVFFGDCLDRALADMLFAAIKTGVIAAIDQVDRIAATARRLPEVPLVVDPVLTTASGDSLADDTVGQAMRDRLFEQAAIITPNAREARALCDGETDLDRCGQRLSGHGCDVLITGGDDDAESEVVNRHYRAGELIETTGWPRLAGAFHGSGCTLASALAARLARGHSLTQAAQGAQRYTWHTLATSFSAGRGQAIPRRIASVAD